MVKIMANTYKLKHERDFFEKEKTIDVIKNSNSAILRIKDMVDFELFRPKLEAEILNKNKGKKGAKPYDLILLLKMLLLKQIYNFSYEKIEFECINQTIFRMFLDIDNLEDIPDANTLCNFFHKLEKNDVAKQLFDEFYHLLENKGAILNEGKIVDATIIEVPIRHNSSKKDDKQCNLIPEENDKKIKENTASWTKKHGKYYFGFKNHIKIDAKSKFIDTYEVTTASTHDSQALEKLLEKSDRGQILYADSAYIGQPIKKMLNKYGVKSFILEKGHRNKPLRVAKKIINRLRSKIRVRIEHIFGFMENSMGGKYRRVQNLQAMRTTVGLMNLCYNIFRYEQVMRLKLLTV